MLEIQRERNKTTKDQLRGNEERRERAEIGKMRRGNVQI